MGVCTAQHKCSELAEQDSLSPSVNDLQSVKRDSCGMKVWGCVIALASSQW